MLQVLSGKLGGDDAEEVWLAACNASFAAMIRDKQSREAEEAKATVSLHLGSCTPGRIRCLTAMGSGLLPADAGSVYWLVKDSIQKHLAAAASSASAVCKLEAREACI